MFGFQLRPCVPTLHDYFPRPSDVVGAVCVRSKIVFFFSNTTACCYRFCQSRSYGNNNNNSRTSPRRYKKNLPRCVVVAHARNRLTGLQGGPDVVPSIYLLRHVTRAARTRSESRNSKDARPRHRTAGFRIAANAARFLRKPPPLPRGR
jgi:hypothetical protein